MNTTNKRVRFTTPSVIDMTTSLTPGSTLTPKACSIQSVRSFAVTLRKHLSPIIQNAGLSHIELLHKWSTKCRQHCKMEGDDTFIPRSARLMNFEFRVSKEVETSEEFLEVKAETEVIIKEFRLNLKDRIMDTLKIEILSTRQKLYENLVKEIYSIIQAKLLSEKKTNDPHVIFTQILHYYLEELLDPFDCNELELCTIYKAVHVLEDIPISNTPNPDAETNEMVEDTVPLTQPTGPSNQSQAIKLRDLSRSCLNTIVSAIIRPHQMYFERLEEIEIDISLKKLHFTSTTEDAAAAAKARLDLEATAPPELVKDLIRGQVSEDTKNLKAELGQLKRQIASLIKNPKNSRGGPPGGAPKSKQITKNRRPKKTSKPTTTTPTSPRNGNRAPPAQKAGAPAKDTNGKPKRGPSNKRKTKKTQRN